MGVNKCSPFSIALLLFERELLPRPLERRAPHTQLYILTAGWPESFVRFSIVSGKGDCRAMRSISCIKANAAAGNDRLPVSIMANIDLEMPRLSASCCWVRPSLILAKAYPVNGWLSCITIALQLNDTVGF
jgi:hypothetical protein